MKIKNTLLTKIVREEIQHVVNERLNQKKNKTLNESLFSELDIIRQESNGFEDFTKRVFSDSRFKSMKKNPEFLAALKSLYGEGRIVKLDTLKFDDIVRTFPNRYNKVQFTRMQPDGKEGPYYSDTLSFPTLTGEVSVNDLREFESWKAEFKKRHGNVNLMLNPYAKQRWEGIMIDDDNFNKKRSKFINGIGDWLDQQGTTE